MVRHHAEAVVIVVHHHPDASVHRAVMYHRRQRHVLRSNAIKYSFRYLYVQLFLYVHIYRCNNVTAPACNSRHAAVVMQIATAIVTVCRICIIRVDADRLHIRFHRINVLAHRLSSIRLQYHNRQYHRRAVDRRIVSHHVVIVAVVRCNNQIHVVVLRIVSHHVALAVVVTCNNNRTLVVDQTIASHHAVRVAVVVPRCRQIRVANHPTVSHHVAVVDVHHHQIADAHRRIVHRLVAAILALHVVVQADVQRHHVAVVEVVVAITITTTAVHHQIAAIVSVHHRAAILLNYRLLIVYLHANQCVNHLAYRRR